MAQFLKFDLTGAQEEALIPVAEIANVETLTTQTTQIDLTNGLFKYVITHEIPLEANGIVKAIYAAMTANPGGIKSTVGIPTKTAQVVTGTGEDGLGGKETITTARAGATYTSSAYSAVV